MQWRGAKPEEKKPIEEILSSMTPEEVGNLSEFEAKALLKKCVEYWKTDEAADISGGEMGNDGTDHEYR